MKDCFNLKYIDKSLLELISSIGEISSICEGYVLAPSSENGEKIVKIMENSEKKMMKVKKNIVRMVNSTEGENKELEPEIESTDNGFLIDYE